MRRIVLFALLGLGMAGVAGAADFSFGFPTRVTLARDYAGSVAIGDANGDGRMDLAVTEDVTTDVHQLSLFIQRADGKLSPPVTMQLPAEFGWAFPVAFADLDHDGTDEIMVGMAKLLVVRLAGGSLATMTTEPVKYGCAYIVTGDIDADGKTDIVCHTGLGTPSSATLLYGNGAGGFRDATDMLTGVGSYGIDPDFMGIQLEDVTGDGFVDLLVTASRVAGFHVYPNDGAGNLIPVSTTYYHPSSPSQVWPASIQVLDIDGDGMNEVVTASPDNRPDARLNIYRRGPNGYLALAERLPIYDSTTALLAADVDGDGDEELVAGHFAFNAVTVLGAESPGFDRQARFELPGFAYGIFTSRALGTFKALALGDLDGDGCIDLAGATHSGATVLYGCEPSASRLPASDFDGDGVSGLLWRSGATKELHLWRWADAQTWRQCPPPCPGYKVPPWFAQAVGDFNGDGNSDVFWRNRETGGNVVLLSSFYERPFTTVTSQDWQVAGTGDFDGDDQSDLLWRNSRTGENAIWKSGDYRKQQLTRRVTDKNWQVVGVGDFNGDG